MQRIELGPILETGQLSELRRILRWLDRSENLLSLATNDVATLLREIDKTNVSWSVLVAAEPDHEP